MTSISWSWDEMWSWYKQIEEQDRQFQVLREIQRDGWGDSINLKDYEMREKNY